MKNVVLALTLLIPASVIGFAATPGCSSDPAGTDTTDAGADTGTAPIDTGMTPRPDTGTPETVPPMPMCTGGVPDPLPTGYTCPGVPTKKPASKVCTDAAITAIYDTCFGSGDPKACSAAQKMYKECAKCMLTDWIVSTADMMSGYIDIGACMQLIDPTSPCGAAENCWYDCRETVCGTCDSTTRGKCYAQARKTGTGACYDNSFKASHACEQDPKFAACLDATSFYRGACRDGGDWSKSGMEMPSDAGTDATSEAATDTGTAPSDTGSAPSDTGSASDASDALIDLGLGG